MTNPRTILRVTAPALLLTAAPIGYAVQGWPGLLLFPLALVIIPVGLFIGWHMLDLVITWERHSTHMSQRRARIARLSTDQLQAVVATPAHPDSGLAFVALARRGIESKPTRAALLELLLSPDPATRGRGMSFLSVFYPEFRLPKGSSSQDSPEVWRDRLPGLTARD